MSRQRPLSPHLTVYRPLIGAFTSILHRAMNTALFAGCGLLALWLLAVAQGGELFDWYSAVLHSLIGRALLVVLTFAGCYSAAQWIRHLFWDMGYGFALETSRRSALAALWGSAAVTLLIWAVVLIR